MKNKIISSIMALSVLITYAAVPYNKVYAQAGDKIIEEGFESDNYCFNVKGACNAAVSTTKPHTGSRCISVTGRNEVWEGIETDITKKLESGNVYRAEAWVRLDGEGIDNAQFCMQLDVDDEPYEKHTYPVIGDAIVNKGQWAQITGLFETIDIASTADVKLYIAAYNDTGNKYDFSVDDVSVFKTDEDVEGYSSRPSDANPVVDYRLTALKDKYNFLLGTARSSDVGHLSDAEDKLIAKHFDIITLTNAMKPDALESFEGRFTWGPADYIVNKNSKNNVKIHGHVLAWHQQTPKWMIGSNRDEALSNLEKYINDVMAHYRGKCYSWDVVNEAISDNITDTQSLDGILRDSEWRKVIGDDWIKCAFEYAAEADPRAKLYYNDYSLEDPLKADAVVTLINYLNEGETLVDGIGIQGHFNNNTSVEMVENTLKKFRALNIKVSISEMDVAYYGATPDEHGNMSYDDQVKQAQKYAQLMQLFRKYDDIIERVSFWGVDDGTSWLSEYYPLLFDKDFKPKQAYYAVLDPDRYLKEHPITDTKASKAVAINGTPDGISDPLWNNVPSANVDKYMLAPGMDKSAARASVKSLWDNKYVYLLVNVEDNTISSDTGFDPVGGTKLSIEEGINVYIDESNDKSADFIPGDDLWIGVDAKGQLLYGAGCGQLHYDNTNHDFEKTDTGYRIYLKIPFSEARTEPGIIGFEVQLNDDTDYDGIRNYSAFFNQPANAMNSTETWGELALSLMGETSDVTEVTAIRNELNESIATGFRADTLNNGVENISFNTVKWYVTSENEKRTTGERKLGTTVTLVPGAHTYISLIVENLYDPDAKASMCIIE